MKRIVSLVLVLVLVFSVCAVSAFAKDPPKTQEEAWVEAWKNYIGGLIDYNEGYTSKALGDNVFEIDTHGKELVEITHLKKTVDPSNYTVSEADGVITISFTDEFVSQFKGFKNPVCACFRDGYAMFMVG